MKKQDFYRYIESHIGQYLPDLESVEIEPFRKNNGTFLDGFMGKQAGSNVSPIIYLEQYYDKVAHGELTEGIAKITTQTSDEKYTDTCYIVIKNGDM